MNPGISGFHTTSVCAVGDPISNTPENKNDMRAARAGAVQGHVGMDSFFISS